MELGFHRFLKAHQVVFSLIFTFYQDKSLQEHFLWL